MLNLFKYISKPNSQLNSHKNLITLCKVFMTTGEYDGWMLILKLPIKIFKEKYVDCIDKNIKKGLCYPLFLISPSKAYNYIFRRIIYTSY